jgi:transmembrane sensor
MPEMGEERLKLLIYKYLDGSLTAAEKEELDVYGSAHPQIWLLMARLQDEDQLMKDLADMQEMDVRQALTEAWGLANEGERPPFHRRYGWTIAASILIVLAGGALFIGLRQPKADSQPSPMQQVEHIPAPEIHGGGNRATLTLANGQQLHLENLPAGQIASQSGARLIKTDSALTYHAVYSENGGGVEVNTLATPRAGTYTIVLPDGSKVWLNNASTLSYPTSFHGRYREVILTGEAYFEVAKNTAQPFQVKVKDLTIHVLGTGFTVRAYGDEGNMTATLLKGKIAVQDGSREEQLAPNEQVTIDRQKNWQIQKDIDPESVMAWKNGNFYFTHADISTVMKELSRWYDIEVEIKIPETQFFYDGEFSHDADLSAILAYLTNEDVHFVREGNKVTVIP